MLNLRVLQNSLTWIQIVLAVWQVIKLTPFGVLIRALIWSATHFKPPFVRRNLLLVGVSNSVYVATNAQVHADYNKGNFSMKYKYAHLGHLAEVSTGSEVRTYHFEEPELYEHLLIHLKACFEDDAAIYMDQGIFIFGVTKFKPLTVLELCESVLVERKNCILVTSKLGIIVDDTEKGSDYFLQSLSLFNLVCKVTAVTVFSTLLYVVLDRWRWGYSQVLSINSKIFTFLTRKLLSLFGSTTRLKIYLSLDPYFPNLQPSNFVTKEVEVKTGEFVFLPNGRFDGFALGKYIDVARVRPTRIEGSHKDFKYEIGVSPLEGLIYRTQICFYFCGTLTVERVYRWPRIKVHFLEHIMEGVCEVGVGPIRACRRNVARVCKMTELLDFIERKNEWYYVGFIRLTNVTLE